MRKKQVDRDSTLDFDVDESDECPFHYCDDAIQSIALCSVRYLKNRGKKLSWDGHCVGPNNRRCPLQEHDQIIVRRREEDDH